MSIRAGSIVVVGARNIVDRLQSAGLTGAVPIETVREIGNDLVVDKVPGEPDFTWSMESWDVTTDMMALLHGGVGSQAANLPPGNADAVGTEYRWEDCEHINIASPWKSQVGSAGGAVGGGLIIPKLYPTRLSYRFGVTDMAAQTVELGGGSFYYAKTAPVEEFATGDGVQVAFVTSEAARANRIGGPAGTTFTRVFGVIVDGVPQTPGVDYVESVPGPTVAGDPALTTITFNVAPALGANVRFAYFSEVAKTYPQAVNADTTIKPGAVRGRNIVVMIGTRGVNQIALPGVQTVEWEATVENEVGREMGNSEPTGREVNGTNANGTVTFRPKDIAAFFNALEDFTGVAQDEVYGYFNDTEVPLEIQIQNPKNPAEILKTIYSPTSKFQPPPLPGRVNTATDFAAPVEAVNGSFSEFKGARP